MSHQYRTVDFFLEDLFSPSIVRKYLPAGHSGALHDIDKETFSKMLEALDQELYTAPIEDQFYTYDNWMRFMLTGLIAAKEDSDKRYKDQRLAPRLQTLKAVWSIYSSLTWSEAEFYKIIDCFADIITERQNIARAAMENRKLQERGR